MNKQLKIYYTEDFYGKQLNIYGYSEQEVFESPLFLAKDVAEWIEYSVSNVNKMLDKVDEEEKTTHTISMNGNYTTQAWFLTEEGNNKVKRHDVLMRDIRKELEALKSLGLGDAHNFVGTSYIDYICLTQKKVTQRKDGGNISPISYKR